jgi:hypothetical protein
MRLEASLAQLRVSQVVKLLAYSSLSDAWATRHSPLNQLLLQVLYPLQVH